MGELTQGMKVRSSDGASLGKIIRVEPGWFVVEKGFFFPKDYDIPTSLVADIREDECWLSVSRAELEAGDDARLGRGEVHDADLAKPAGQGAVYRTVEGARDEEQRMQLSEEELEASKRVREAGEVRVRKEVVTEHRQIDVPVTKEEVHVERVPASGTAEPRGDAFREEEIRMPVREEEVEITKRPRVREEIRVSRTGRQEERRVEGEVRREEARIEGTDEKRVPDAGYGTPPDDEHR